MSQKKSVHLSNDALSFIEIMSIKGEPNTSGVVNASIAVLQGILRSIVTPELSPDEMLLLQQVYKNGIVFSREQNIIKDISAFRNGLIYADYQAEVDKKIQRLLDKVYMLSNVEQLALQFRIVGG